MNNYSKFDKDKFAELVKQAKGPNRTMQQFASDMGVQPSTLSRIVNLKNESPSSLKLLKDIALYADRNSGVTIEQLLECNGMSNQVIDENRNDNLVKGHLESFENALEQVGFSYEDKYVRWSPDSLYQMDLAIETNNWIWAVDYYFGEKISTLPTGCGKINFWIMKAMSVLYSNSKVMKISSIVERKVIFEQIKARIQNIKTDRPISIIYISKNKIEEACTLNYDGIPWNTEKWIDLE